MLTSPDEAIIRALAVATCDLDLAGPGPPPCPSNITAGLTEGYLDLIVGPAACSASTTRIEARCAASAIRSPAAVSSTSPTRSPTSVIGMSTVPRPRSLPRR